MDLRNLKRRAGDVSPAERDRYLFWRRSWRHASGFFFATLRAISKPETNSNRRRSYANCSTFCADM